MLIDIPGVCSSYVFVIVLFVCVCVRAFLGDALHKGSSVLLFTGFLNLLF